MQIQSNKYLIIVRKWRSDNFNLMDVEMETHFKVIALNDFTTSLRQLLYLTKKPITFQV